MMFLYEYSDIIQLYKRIYIDSEHFKSKNYYLFL